MNWLVRLMEGAGRLVICLRGRSVCSGCPETATGEAASLPKRQREKAPTGTFIRKQDAAWLREQLQGKMALRNLFLAKCQCPFFAGCNA
jgi:hypothetical protein